LFGWVSALSLTLSLSLALYLSPSLSFSSLVYSLQLVSVLSLMAPYSLLSALLLTRALYREPFGPGLSVPPIPVLTLASLRPHHTSLRDTGREIMI
jgi:hypothetical protein